MFEYLYVRNSIRQAYALALHSGFLNRMSLPLGAIDIFSTACHPSQTVYQLVSSKRVSDEVIEKWCYIGA